MYSTAYVLYYGPLFYVENSCFARNTHLLFHNKQNYNYTSLHRVVKSRRALVDIIDEWDKDRSNEIISAQTSDFYQTIILYVMKITSVNYLYMGYISYIHSMHT